MKKQTAQRVSTETTGLFRQQANVVIGAAVLALVGAVGFWLTPLRDLAMQRLYPERAELLLIPDRASLTAGQPVQIQVKISQKSSLPTTAGLATLHFDTTALTLAPDTVGSMNTGAVSGAMTLDKPFVLFALGRSARDTEVHATLETRHGTYRSPALKIQVIDQPRGEVPFIEHHGSQAINLSGGWHIELGAARGDMKVTQDAGNNVTGTYIIEGLPGRLKLDGYKDGTSFKVFLFRDDAGTRRWRVDANFALNPSDKRFVEIRGCAFDIQRDARVTADSGLSSTSSGDCPSSRNYVGWRGLGVSQFYATAQIRL